MFPAGYDSTKACESIKLDGNGDVEFTWPAAFPNPQRTVHYVLKDYRLNCPTFTIERITDKYMKVQGLTPAQLVPLLNVDNYDVPYLMREGNVMLEFGEGNTIYTRVKGDRADRRIVLAALQSVGDFKALAFDGGFQDVTFDPSLPVTIFNREGTFWEKMTWDDTSRTMVFYVTAPFPAF